MPNRSFCAIRAVLVALAAELLGQAAPLGEQEQGRNQVEIARRFELGDRQLAIGAARIADDDRQLVFFGAILREREIVGDLGRLAVLVGAQHAHVEVVAREVEVVRVAAEERHRQFRREHQAHVLVAMVLVYVVDAAVVQVDHVAARVLAVLADAFLLDVGLHRLLGAAVILATLALGRLLHARGDMGDLIQTVQLDLRALDLVLLVLGEKAGLDEVLVGGRELLHAGVHAMMVGQHEAVRRHERTGAAAGEAQRGALHAPGPLRIRREAVLRLDLRLRQVVRRPHAFAREGADAGGESEKQGDGDLVHRDSAVRANRCSTPARSSRSSLAVASMRSRENALISRPCTIWYLPFLIVTG